MPKLPGTIGSKFNTKKNDRTMNKPLRLTHKYKRRTVLVYPQNILYLEPILEIPEGKNKPIEKGTAITFNCIESDIGPVCLSVDEKLSEIDSLIEGHERKNIERLIDLIGTTVRDAVGI